MERFAPHLPYESFPLTRHPTGRWCKKHKQATYFYGKIADGWQSALQNFEWFYASFDSQGRTRPAADNPDGLTVALMCDHYYAAKKQRHDSGELAESSLADYDDTCKSDHRRIPEAAPHRRSGRPRLHRLSRRSCQTARTGGVGQ